MMLSNKNSTSLNDISSRSAAVVAGLSLLLMAILAPFANFYVLGNLVVANDATATANNILASLGLFRIAIIVFLVVAVLDVVVAWALYILLEPVNKSLSLLAAWFRLVYAAVFAVALLPLLNIVQLLGTAAYLQAFEANQLHAQIMVSLGAFHSGWDLGLLLFGFHLLLLGYLVFKSGDLPKWLGILIGIAGLGYLIDSFGKLLILNYTVSIAMFTFIGEFLLIFWLLWWGMKRQAQSLAAQPRRA